MIEILEAKDALAKCSEAARPLLRFLAAAQAETVKGCTGNSDANLAVATSSRAVIPIAVSRNGGGTGYLVTTTRTYMDGAALEFAKKPDWLLRTLAPVAALSGHAGRALGLDTIVSVNNILHPTSPSIDWSAFDVTDLAGALTARFPKHALFLRGLNDGQDSAVLERLRAAGYTLAFARPIKLLDASATDFRMTKELKRDRNRVSRLEGLTPFHGGPLSLTDYERMTELYHRTYIDGHGYIHPHYTARFFRHSHESGLFVYHGLRDDSGRIAGFISTMENSRGIGCGTYGRSHEGQQAQHIYPSLLAMAMMEAVEKRAILNLGFGAFDFKRRRGALSAIEYYAFYTRHLSAPRRALWDTLTSAINVAAGPLVKRL